MITATITIASTTRMMITADPEWLRSPLEGAGENAD